MQLLKYCSVASFLNMGDQGLFLTEDPAYRAHLDEREQARKKAKKKSSATSRKAKAKGLKTRRAKTTPEIRWLKNLICPFVYGEKTPDGVRPSVTKKDFLSRWATKYGLPSLPNYKLLDHFRGKETLYFIGQGSKRHDRTLVMIDIDVLKHRMLGSPKGARRFAEYLKTIWPDLYIETSTNGQGVHGYIVLVKRQADAKRTNAALKRLEAWLRAEAMKTGADIEQVEVKGTCLDMTFDGKLLQAVKYGMFAKLPRDVARFEELQATTVLRVQDLECSLFDVTEREKAAKTRPVPAMAESEAVIPFPVTEPVQSSKKNKSVTVAGSVSGKFINDGELAAIPAFERLYREWVGPDDMMAGKFRVTAHDFAVAMLLLRHFKAQPNDDRSLPCRRVQELWTGLWDAGDIHRAWNHHRWKKIRDFLSARGHIDWTDHRYEPPVMVKNEKGKWGRAKDGNGKSSRGLACQWAITDEFDLHLERVASMTTLSAGGASFVDTRVHRLVPAPGKGKNLRPVRHELKQLRFWQRAEAACDRLFAA